MSCNPELVSAFLDGELDSIIVDKVTTHLMECDSCRKVMSRLVQVRDAFSEKFTVSDPEALTSAVMAAIKNEQFTPSPQKAKLLESPLVRYGIPASIAAAALATLIQQSGK